MSDCLLRLGRSTPLVLALLLSAACDGELPQLIGPLVPQPPGCPEGTELVGNQCAPNHPLAPTDPRVLIGEPDGGDAPDPEPSMQPDPEPSMQPDPEPEVPGDVTLPFFLEEYFAMAGFFTSDGIGSPTTDRTPCVGVEGTAAGANCFRIVFTPGGATFGGFYWHYLGEADGSSFNWGQYPGLDIPQGAQQIKFRAWGENGGERVKFGAGIDNAEPFSDGFTKELVRTLTTEPTEYFIDLRDITYSSVTGAFFWAVETPSGTGSVTFYVDNIEWTDEPPDEIPVGPAIELPFFVDGAEDEDGNPQFVMSGFFPGPPATTDVVESCEGVAGTDPGSLCRTITFTPNGGGFGGFFWFPPQGDFGEAPGKPIAPGATQVTFRAWGAAPGVNAKFGVGFNNATTPYQDGWGFEGPTTSLPTTPTEYALSVANITYDQVVSPFLWVVESAVPVTFYIDNIRWQ
jgi:hypothetical protein